MKLNVNTNAFVCLLAIAACKTEAAFSPDDDGGESGMDGAEGDAPLPDFTIGNECMSDGDCEGGDLAAFCISEAGFGYPGGYCSARDCSLLEDDCPGGPDLAVCLGEPGLTYCFDLCEIGGDDCRIGYACVVFSLEESAGICLPGDAGANIGDACQTIADCPPGGDCWSEAVYGYPSGNCVMGCTLSFDQCPAGSRCVPTGADTGVCFRECSATEDCRDAYDCFEIGTVEISFEACYPSCGSDTQCSSPRECNPNGFCGPPFDEDLLGGPCTDLLGCPGAFCLTEEQSGTPGGYCVSGCTAEDETCLADGVCILNDGQEFGTCLDGCTTDVECREAYRCAEFEDGLVCWPEMDAAAIGDECEQAGDCVGGSCIDEAAAGWPGGYCVGFPCSSELQDCPLGAVCIDEDNADGSPIGFCGDDCEADDDCRTGYGCRDLEEGFACYPDFNFSDLGDPCESGADCVGGACLTEIGGGWPGGTCAYFPCSGEAQDCPTGFCYDLVDDGVDRGVCLTECSSDEGCRDGYSCSGVTCLPDCGDADCLADGYCCGSFGLCEPC